MVIAQSLGEYGALGSLMSTFSGMWAIVQEQARRADPSTWLLILLGAVLIWFLFIRN